MSSGCMSRRSCTPGVGGGEIAVSKRSGLWCPPAECSSDSAGVGVVTVGVDVNVLVDVGECEVDVGVLESDSIVARLRSW